MTIVVNNNNKIAECIAEQQRYRCRCRCNSRNSYYDLQEVANVLMYLLSSVSKDACFFRRMNCINNNNNNNNNRQQRPLLELALRLLREIAITSSSTDDDDEKDDGDDNIEPATALIRRIEQNEVSHLILRNVRLFDSSRNSKIHTNMADNLSSQSPVLPSPPSSSYWNFDEVTVRQAAEALKSNHSIRSISCQYDFNNNNFNNLASLAAGRQRYYPRMITSSSSSTTSTTAVSGTNSSNHSIIVSTRKRNYIHEQQHRRQQQPINNNMHVNNNNNNNYNVVSRQHEHSFIEACICLPRLESLSLTGNNRWRISHLCQILETVKGLKRLTIRDVVVRSKIELYNLQRCLIRLRKQRTVGRGAGIPLEEIDLTIEDQTEWYHNNSSNRNCRDRKKKQSHYCDESCYSSCSCSCSCSSSLFDGLLEILITNIPNLKIISITKSILSRLNILLRPISVDISTTTLIQLTKYSSLSKLKLVGLSFERYSIESMCKLLIKQCHKEKNNNSNNNRNDRRRRHHITHLEFTGCAFNQTVSQSDWNAMFHLIRHDPNIQIIASSVIYHRVHVRQQQQRQHPHRYSCSSCDEQNIDNNNNNRYNEQPRVGEGGSSTTIQRPHHDFLFSLRDKDGTNRHFHNRGMEIEYILQEAGFFRLLQQRGEEEHEGRRQQRRPRRRSSTIMDWIDVMVKVKDDSIALFYILRENPALCAIGVLKAY